MTANKKVDRFILKPHRKANDDEQVAQVARVRSLFGDIPLPDIEVFESPPEHYRMRCVGMLGMVLSIVHLKLVMVSAALGCVATILQL